MNEAQRLKKGDIWTVVGGKDYAGKPRPVVIVQDDSFDATNSITICAFTIDETEAPLFRLTMPHRSQWLAGGVAIDGGQDYDCAKDQGWDTCRQVGRRRHPAAQSGRTCTPGAGCLAEDEAGELS